MTTLKHLIEEAERNVKQQEAMLTSAKANLQALLHERANCVHIFTPPIKGYEHEGGYCAICGINELHAHTLKQSK